MAMELEEAYEYSTISEDDLEIGKFFTAELAIDTALEQLFACIP